jgi:hypothetical protein
MTACTADTDPVPVTRNQAQTPTTVALRPSATPTPFQTATTQNTALPTLTNTPTAIPSHTPTRTPRPSPTATATPLTHYALPDWIDDPDAPVVLAHIGHPEVDDGVISLFNLLTNERWDLLSNPSSNWANAGWNQIEDDVYIELAYSSSSPDGARLVRVAIPDGEISQWPARPFGWYSNDGRSLIQFIREPNIPVQAIMTTSFELGQDTLEGLSLSDPFNGRYDNYVEAVWSPDDAFIAVSHVSFPPTPDGTALYGLAIRTADGELFRTYDGVRFAEWLPNEPLKLLHFTIIEEEHRIPCILDVVSGDNNCINELETWQEEPSVEVFQFRSSPDGGRISFITYPDPAVCYFDLSTQQVNCPVVAEDLVMDDYQFFAITHDWSEDGHYLSVIMNPNGPRSDDGSYNFLAVTTIAGNDFRILGKTSSSDRKSWWRPSLNN